MAKNTFTQIDENGRYFLDGKNCNLSADMFARIYGDAIDRLGDFEHPQRAERELLIVLLQKAAKCISTNLAEHIADYLMKHNVFIASMRKGKAR